MFVERHSLLGVEVVTMLGLIALVIGWDKINRLNCIPSSVVAVCLGIITAIIWPGAHDMHFVSELFLYLLLPPILFNSALQFRLESLKRTWLASSLFAWVGTLGSILLIGWGIQVWTAGTDLHFTFVDALLIASFLAPTDTVATISLASSLELGETYFPEVLENESVMNDAISVVLVRLFAQMSAQHTTMDRWVPMEAIGFALLNAAAASLIGYVGGYLIRRLEQVRMALHLVAALFLYSLCESIGLSGIVALFIYGSTIRKVASKQMKETVSSLSEIVEAYVYVMLGLAWQDYSTEHWSISFFILISCVVARVVMVFLLGLILRCAGRKQWTMRTLLFFSMCGVRGAISFALCMSMKSDHTSFVRSTTFMVIISTIVLMGSLQRCMHAVLLEPDKNMLGT
jgi:NhaP-type Na+/H+ or K+/H+ antiporter